MLQDWENGNAAKQPDYDQQSVPNLFTPIDYNARLQKTDRRRRSTAGSSYQPGAMYGAPTPSAPPMAAPEYEAPSYLQQQAWFPEQEWQPDASAPVQGEAGAPYSAALFEHQPTAVMPSGWDVNAFADQPVQDFWQDAPAQTPAWEEEEAVQEDQPVYYSAADIPLRDAFTPAQPRENQKAKPAPKVEAPKRRRLFRLDQIPALIALILLIIALAVGIPLVAETSRNEREVEAFHAEYLEENGVDVYNGAAKVDLLPEGQTYVPTATPSPTIYAPTPSPTPIIPISEALVMGAGTAADAVQQPQETPAPALRTRLTAYPKNPMCNIMESIREMVNENSDVVGRLVIEGVLDEMVMQRNNTYYLTHNAIGTTSEAGAVFADESCSLRIPTENLLLRGQSGVPGKTFAPLWQYVSGGRDFVAANMMARLTTLYEEEPYVLFAVVVANRDPANSQYFNYASHPTFESDEAMLRYVESARQRSLYQFNVDVMASDRLLTLATLGPGENTLVLLYRMVRDTENMGM